MPGAGFDSDSDFDSQDQAEAFDESNLVGGEGAKGVESTFGEADDMGAFEELPDVLDLTRADGDRDEAEALALDADEFQDDAFDGDDLEADDELDYQAATEEREDDLDGLGLEDAYDEDQLDPDEIEGLDEVVMDAEAVSGGEDDFTNFQSRSVSDADLEHMGYSEQRGGETRAKPDED